MIILRDYQIDSINSLRNGFVDGHNRQILCASCGAGKSIIMTEMIRMALEKNKKIGFLCERRILVSQFSEHLDRAGIDHGILMQGTNRWRPNELVQIGTLQTLNKMELWPEFDILFVDEIHAAMHNSLVKIINERPSMKVIGSTSTPFHPLLYGNFTSITNVITMKELVQSGNLVPFKVFSATEIDVNGVEVKNGEWEKVELEKRGRLVVGNIVRDYMELSHMVFGGYRKTICFSSGVIHGSELQQEFNKNGIHAVQVSYKDDNLYKKEVLEEFSKPDTSLKVLISVGILERGFDQTDVEHVILARPLKKSFSSHVQSVGRGARPHEGKKFAVIQDHSGNWLRFLEEWNDLYNNGVHEISKRKEKSKSEPTKKEKDASVCPKCKYIWPANSNTCAFCGHVRLKRNDVVSVNGIMKEVSEDDIAITWEYKRNFFQQMLGFCEQHKKPLYTAKKWFEKKFKHSYPSDVIPKPIAPGIDVQNYCKSRLIAYAYRK